MTDNGVGAGGLRVIEPGQIVVELGRHVVL
jgi:hypothetical protein